MKTYPKCKRIDIGYAKKMKYTRYAFVTFKSVQDSIEAFKKTHSTQMYSKSLIVRFRRLHGTVGMPGESKPQHPPKNKDGNAGDEGSSTTNEHVEQVLDDVIPVKDKSDDVNLTLVKTEPDSSGDEEEDGDENICDISEHRPIKLEKLIKEEPAEESKMGMMKVDKKEVDDIKEEDDDDDEDDNEDQQRHGKLFRSLCLDVMVLFGVIFR